MIVSIAKEAMQIYVYLAIEFVFNISSSKSMAVLYFIKLIVAIVHCNN
jgi:hypothetical protein